MLNIEQSIDCTSFFVLSSPGVKHVEVVVTGSFKNSQSTLILITLCRLGRILVTSPQFINISLTVDTF